MNPLQLANMLKRMGIVPVNMIPINKCLKKVKPKNNNFKTPKCIPTSK